MKKKVTPPKAGLKAKTSRKLPPTSPVGLSPETKAHPVDSSKEWIGIGLPPEIETLIATLSDQQRQMMRTAFQVVVRTKLTPKVVIEDFTIFGSLIPNNELIRIGGWSPEEIDALGWKPLKSWDGLFSLFRKGNGFVAEMSDRLVAIHSKYRKANTQEVKNKAGIGNEELEKLQRALFLLNLRKRKVISCGEMDAIILSDLTESIGAMMSEAWHYIPKKLEGAVSLQASSSDSGSLNRAEELKRFFSRAVDGLMKLKYPTRAKSSGADVAKEVLAIEQAKLLCGNLCRLPTKSEVRFAMEEQGHRYSDERSRAASNWKNLFKRCGLEALKD